LSWRECERKHSFDGLRQLTVRLAVRSVAVLAAALPAVAFAAAGTTTDSSEFLLLAQIATLILVGRLLGEFMQRIGQPAVIGQLLGGVLLGPSFLGLLWPSAQHALFPSNPHQMSMINAIAQLGILMLLLLAGMETDFGLIKRIRRAALSTSISGIALPFACGFLLGESLPSSILPQPQYRLITALFLGTALSISSVKVVAVVVREMNFARRNLGQVILATAIIDDTVGWIIIAVTLSLASRGRVDLKSVGASLLGTALFLIVSFTLGRRVVFGLIRFTNDHFVSEGAVVTAILLLMAGMALTTQLIGVHTVLGAFVAGILIGESPILTHEIGEQLGGLTSALFMPVFFGTAGLTADLTILRHPNFLVLTLGLILIASVGKFSGAFAGAYWGGFTRREALALGCALNARGATEVIVASIGLSMGVLTQNLYTLIVTMAMITTMIMPPTLRWTLNRVPLSPEEKARLEKEEVESRGFVPGLERLLVAVDDSVNGTFVARLAGLIAGTRGMPVTVLQEDIEIPPGRAANVLKGAAAAGRPSDRGTAQARPPAVDVTTRSQKALSAEAVALEANRGYDLLMIGRNTVRGGAGEFHEGVSRVAAAFEGPVAVALALGAHAQNASCANFNILAPITGSEVSRHGAEVAVALARATHCPLTVLYVAAQSTRAKTLAILGAQRREQEAVLKDIVKIADQYGVRVRTAVTAHASPAKAILEQARRGKQNLIVMGVSRRPGETLSFGEVAAAVLENTERSVLFVAS
jgi:Kef-type K+ transport system membrane component KefB/nucleotide-binding universal stress UspA family protein